MRVFQDADGYGVGSGSGGKRLEQISELKIKNQKETNKNCRNKKHSNG